MNDSRRTCTARNEEEWLTLGGSKTRSAVSSESENIPYPLEEPEGGKEWVRPRQRWSGGGTGAEWKSEGGQGVKEEWRERWRSSKCQGKAWRGKAGQHQKVNGPLETRAMMKYK